MKVIRSTGASAYGEHQARADECRKSLKTDRTPWYTRYLLGACYLIASTCSFASQGVFTVLDPLQFIEQNGQSFNEEKLQGKIVLISFMFTHCSDVCPTQTQSLVRFNNSLSGPLRERIHLLSISIDPEHDTPMALNAFAQRLKATHDNWSFVTAPVSHIDSIVSQLQLMNPVEKTPELDDHKTAVWLVDTQGRVMQRYRGQPLDVDRLKREVEQLSKLRFP